MLEALNTAQLGTMSSKLTGRQHCVESGSAQNGQSTGTSAELCCVIRTRSMY